MADFSIWALEYAVLKEYPVAALLYGVLDQGVRELPFYYTVIQDEDHTILVDTGFDRNDFGAPLADAYNVQSWADPATTLARVGLTPADVDTVILTHHHWDHAANIGAFPNSTVFIQRREVDSYMAKLATAPNSRWLAHGLDPATMHDLTTAGYEGRLRMPEGSADVVPGVKVRPAFDTHTAGSQYVVLALGESPLVLTGDAVYVMDNIAGMNGDGVMIPVGLGQGNQEQCIRVMGDILEDAGGDLSNVVPSHDVGIWSTYPSKEFDDGLHVAEIALARGATSRVQ